MIVIDVFKKLIPTKTNYSYDKVVRFFGHQDKALQYPYVRVNEQNKVYFLVFDIDKPFVDRGLTPSYLVVTPETQRSHAVFVLESPVVKERQPRAWSFMDRVTSLCRLILESDRAITCQKLLTKNPFHTRWQYVGMSERAYSLTELYTTAKRILKLNNSINMNKIKTPSNFVEDSRNCNIFNVLRQRNFDSLKEYIDYATEINLDVADKLGKPPLDGKDIISIAKSVWKYKQKKNG